MIPSNSPTALPPWKVRSPHHAAVLGARRHLQRVERERLLDVVVGPKTSPGPPLGRPWAIIPGDRRLLWSGRGGTCCRARHLDVGQGNRVRARAALCLVAVARLEDLVAGSRSAEAILRAGAARPASGIFIAGSRPGRPLRRRRPRPRRPTSEETRVNVAPLPGSLFTSTHPPCASMTLARSRADPGPVVLVVRRDGRCGSGSRAGCPGRVAHAGARISPSSSRADSVIGLPVHRLAGIDQHVDQNCAGNVTNVRAQPGDRLLDHDPGPLALPRDPDRLLDRRAGSTGALVRSGRV